MKKKRVMRDTMLFAQNGCAVNAQTVMSGDCESVCFVRSLGQLRNKRKSARSRVLPKRSRGCCFESVSGFFPPASIRGCFWLFRSCPV